MTSETKSVCDYFREQLQETDKMLLNLDVGIQHCNTLLYSAKFKLSALEIQMMAMKSIYQDLMELRKLIIILNPHLRQK